MPLLSSLNFPKIKPIVAYFVAIAAFLNLTMSDYVEMNYDLNDYIRS